MATTPSASALFANLIHAFSYLEGAGEKFDDVEIVLVEGATAKLAEIRPKIGAEDQQTIQCRVDGETVDVTLASLDELSWKHHELPEREAGTSPMREFVQAVGALTAEQIAAGQQVLMDHLVECFRGLCERDQLAARLAFRKLPRAVGVAAVSMFLPEMHLDIYYEDWRKRSKFVYVVTSHPVVLRTRTGRTIMDEQYYRDMRDMWLQQARNATGVLRQIRADPSPAVQEVLRLETPGPEVEEPAPPGDEDPDVGRELLGPNSRIDPEREVFYQGQLKCSTAREVTRPFRVRRYVAYEWVAPSGAVVLIYDNRWTGNAAYLFLKQRAGETVETDWLRYAEMTRRQLIALLAAGQAVQPHPVLARVEHVPEVEGDWREPIRQVLARL